MFFFATVDKENSQKPINFVFIQRYIALKYVKKKKNRRNLIKDC